MIVGLTGVARSGKDTVGQILVEHYGFERRAFADKLRAVALGADPYVHLDINDGLGEPAFVFERLSSVVEVDGWERAKEHADVRRFLQRLGTEGVRTNLGADAWIAAAMNPLALNPLPKVVFTDVRYPNEAKAIHNHGGVVWCVMRPGYGPVNAHASDAGLDLDLIDRIIANGGTLEELRLRVAGHLNDLERNAHV